MKKKVVVIGGGNGAAVVLRALKPFAEQLAISAVINTSDSGSSSGELRKEFHVLPPGDLQRAILALSKYDYDLLSTLFRKNRFSSGKLKGHNIGNLFLALAAEYSGGMLAAMEALGEAVEAVGKVYPVTLQPVELCVELSNGEKIISEAVIDRPHYDRDLRITRAWLEAPAAPAYEGAVAAIRAADHILIGPGSLYTSLVAALLPAGIKEALAASQAKLWYSMARGFEGDAETGPAKLSEFVAELEAYLPRPLDGVLYNNRALDGRQKEKYAHNNWVPIAHDVVQLPGKRLVGADFEEDDGGYSAEKLGVLLQQLLHL